MDYNKSDFEGQIFKPFDPSTIDSYNFDVDPDLDLSFDAL